MLLDVADMFRLAPLSRYCEQVRARRPAGGAFPAVDAIAGHDPPRPRLFYDKLSCFAALRSNFIVFDGTRNDGRV